MQNILNNGKTCRGYGIKYNITQLESQEDDNTFQVDGLADYPKQSENMSRINRQTEDNDNEDKSQYLH